MNSCTISIVLATVLPLLDSFIHSISALPITRAEYKLAAAENPRVLPGTHTELWAEVHRPAAKGSGPYPLVIFLHGNHGTCGTFKPSGIRRDRGAEYTFTGACPPPSTVVPNHRGFRYIAAPLASRGVIVVSINANRGINANVGDFSDPGLILARGRLVMDHIALLAKWHRGRETTPSTLKKTLRGQIDFTNVGFMGHSRGGEGVRAALHLYGQKHSPWPQVIKEKLRIKAIFEIAPVDGQSNTVLNVGGVASSILLPTCDGDVSNLDGMRVFDRVFDSSTDHVERPKSTFTVAGANHNAFNTEWQESEASGCIGTRPLFNSTGPSIPQQKIAKIAILAFMRAHLLGVTQRAAMFDPHYELTNELRKITFYERGHLRAPPSKSTGVRVIQAFSGPDMTSDAGFRNTFNALSVEHASAALVEHDPNLRTAQIDWHGQGDSFYSINLNGNQGIPLMGVKTLSFRIALACGDPVCSTDIDARPDVHIQISLADNRSKMSRRVSVNDYVRIRRPTGLFTPHDLLQTVEIPFRAFVGLESSTITKIQFSFLSPTKGRVFLGQISTDTEGAGVISNARQEIVASPEIANSGISSRLALPAAPVVGQPHNRIVSVSFEDNLVHLQLSSSIPFPYSDSLPRLTVGGIVSRISLVVGRCHRILFMLTSNDFDSIVAGDEVTVSFGSKKWMFGVMPVPSTLIA